MTTPLTLDPARVYDYLTRSRRRVLDLVRTLGAEEYARAFPIGPGSLAATLTHIYISEWYYIERLHGRHVPPYDTWPVRDETPPPFAELESLWTKQAADTLAAIRAVHDWNAPITYQVTDDDGRVVRVSCTAADLFTQLALHEVHHRAQALNILRQLGKTVAGDIDFNAMMYNRAAVV